MTHDFALGLGFPLEFDLFEFAKQHAVGRRISADAAAARPVHQRGPSGGDCHRHPGDHQPQRRQRPALIRSQAATADPRRIGTCRDRESDRRPVCDRRQKRAARQLGVGAAVRAGSGGGVCLCPRLPPIRLAQGFFAGFRLTRDRIIGLRGAAPRPGFLIVSNSRWPPASGPNRRSADCWKWGGIAT